MVVLSASHRLRLEGNEMCCLELFRRTLELIDLHDRSSAQPRILRYGHLGLYDVSDWSDAIQDNINSTKAKNKRLGILNPVTPVLNVINSVIPGILKQWSDSAEEALVLLNSRSASIRDIFGDWHDNQYTMISYKQEALHEKIMRFAAVALPVRLRRLSEQAEDLRFKTQTRLRQRPRSHARSSSRRSHVR